MKHLSTYIFEKFKITKNIKISKYLDVDEIEGPETEGEDYSHDQVIILGKPFKNEKDPNYKYTMEYIKKKYKNESIWTSFEDIKDEPGEYFVYTKIKNDHGIYCWVYGDFGVLAFRNKQE